MKIPRYDFESLVEELAVNPEQADHLMKQIDEAIDLLDRWEKADPRTDAVHDVFAGSMRGLLEKCKRITDEMKLAQ